MTESSKIHVYIDESGSTNIEVPDGESPFYVCVAILVREENICAVKAGIDNISQRLNSGAVIKSSKIGNNHKRRITFAEDFSKLDFQYFAVLVNKNLLKDYPGLQYKKSYYKYINKTLYNLLSKFSTSDIIITADGFGNMDFQESCKEYFQREIEDLFKRAKFTFAADENCRVIQLADFIAGSINKYYFELLNSEEGKQLITLLKSKELYAETIPYGTTVSETAAGFDDQLNANVWSLLNRKALSFISNNAITVDPKVQMQVVTLKQLYAKRKYENDNYIFSDELIRILEQSNFAIKKQSFTTTVIGGLRRAGVIISGTSDGYKLALSLEDIREYLDHDRIVIEPMLEKLRFARGLLQAELSYDILSEDRYSNLAEFLRVMLDERVNMVTELDDESVRVYEETDILAQSLFIN